MLLTETDDVPDDQEVAGKSQLCNQLKLMLCLLAGSLHQSVFDCGCIAFAYTFIDALGQKAIHGFAVRDRVLRKLVAEIVQCEFKPFTHNASIGNRLRNIAKEIDISRAERRWHKEFLLKEPPSIMHSRVVANRSKYVEKFTIALFGTAQRRWSR